MAKKHAKEEVNEFAAEAEKTGDLTHKEALDASSPGTTTDQALRNPEPQDPEAAEKHAKEQAKHDAQMAKHKKNLDGDVHRPELAGHKKEDYGQPRDGSSSVQRVQDIGLPPDQRPK